MKSHAKLKFDNQLIVKVFDMNSNATTSSPESNPPRRRIWQVLGVIGAIGAVLAVIGLIYQAIAVNVDRQRHPPVGRMVNVGTHSLHMVCTGEGSPTVVMIAGAGNMYAHWDLVQTSASQFTRVCSFDRAGTGWSDYPSTQPTLDTHVEDLHNLLKNSGEQGPFVLVGHSMGGIQARWYYNKYPEDVRAMVLVESSVEGMYQHLPSIISESNNSAQTIWTVCRVLAPFGIIRLVGLGNSYAAAFPNYSDEARAAMTATFNRTENCRGAAWESALTSVFNSGEPTTLNDLPIIVLTRGLDEVQANPNQRFTDAQKAQFEQVQADWLVLQQKLVALSTNSTQVMATKSGHFVQANEPALVVNAIQDVIKRSAQ